MLHGLHTTDDDTLTLDEVGEHLGLSRERVRQLEARALRKLRCVMAIEHLVGRKRAEPIFQQLAGKPLDHFERALRETKSRD